MQLPAAAAQHLPHSLSSRERFHGLCRLRDDELIQAITSKKRPIMRAVMRSLLEGNAGESFQLAVVMHVGQSWSITPSYRRPPGAELRTAQSPTHRIVPENNWTAITTKPLSCEFVVNPVISDPRSSWGAFRVA